jgi:hypothetical protein
MSDDPSPKEPVNVAQQLGADTGASGTARAVSDRLHPLTVAGLIRELTQAHPLAMLSLAFLAGAACFGGRQRR